MTLLVTSGMLVRSLTSLGRVDPGFQVGSLLTARVELPAYKYASRQEWGLAWDQTMRRIEAIPGVQGVAVADWLPVTPGAGPWNGLSRPGAAPRAKAGGQAQAPRRSRSSARHRVRKH